MKSYKDIRKERKEWIMSMRGDVLNQIQKQIEDNPEHFYENNFAQFTSIYTDIVVEDLDYYNAYLRVYGWELVIRHNRLSKIIIEIHPYFEPKGFLDEIRNSLINFYAWLGI